MRAWLEARGWLEGWKVYGDRRVIAILFLGFSSGLPIMLVATTLSTWLREEDVSRAAIGLFGFVFAPYTFKFAWAPFMDRLPLPPFTTLLGRRRGWMLAAQIGLILSIWALGRTEPGVDLYWTAVLAVAVAFFSASQDIVIDAYRVEILPEEKLGAGAGVIVLGYRVAMWVATAGALFIADLAGWSLAYAAMAMLVLVGMVTVLLVREPQRSSTALIDETVLEEDRLTRALPEAELGRFRDVGGLMLFAIVFFGLWQPLSWLFGVLGPEAPPWNPETLAVATGNLAITVMGALVAWQLWTRHAGALALAKNFALLAFVWLVARTLWMVISAADPFFAELHAWLFLAAVWWVADLLAARLADAGFAYDAVVTPAWLTVVAFWVEFLAVITLYGFTYFSRRAQAHFGIVAATEEATVHLWVRRAVIEPFYDFVRRNGLAIAVVILAFISVYKASDVLLTLMANPFYIDVGFTKGEIAWVSGTFGLWMTLLGGLIGGVLVYRLGIMRALVVAVILMATSNAFFALLAVIGPDFRLFHLVIMVENVSGGLGTTVFVAYLSSLCNIHYTAVQYALLTSFMQLLGKFVIVPSSGFYADAVGWIWFFLTSVLFAVPALLLLWLLFRQGLAVDKPVAADGALEAGGRGA